jgi:hypothetical protein
MFYWDFTWASTPFEIDRENIRRGFFRKRPPPLYFNIVATPLYWDVGGHLLWWRFSFGLIEAPQKRQPESRGHGQKY